MGEVTVSMTFTENAITDVTVDTANETIDLARNSAEDFRKALMEAQSAEIDSVSGATYTSDAVNGSGSGQLDKAGTRNFFHSGVLPFFFFRRMSALASCIQKHYTINSLSAC